VRVLYITNGFPFPITSGYLRHYHFIRGLSARHEITLLSMVGPGHRPHHRDAMSPYLAALSVYPRNDRETIGARLGDRLSRLVPIRATGGMRDLLSDARALVASGEVDVIFFSGKQTYPALAGLAGVPVLADACDTASARVLMGLRRRGRRRGPRIATDLLEAAALRWVEQRIVRRAHHALFASERDRGLLRASHLSTSVVPNGVDTEFWRRSRPELGLASIVFTGKLDYAPNVDAATTLVNLIMPRVWREFPEAKVTLVGRDPTPAVRELGTRRGVEVTGEVPDVRPYLEGASVFAAPLRFASGIQNKLLEAMAMEVPVVTSPVAAAGLVTAEGDPPPVTVADAHDDFASRLIGELHRTGRDRTPHTPGRAYVTRHFDWDRAVDRIEALLAGMAPASPALGSGIDRIEEPA